MNALVVEDYKLIADAWGNLLMNTNFFKKVKVIYSPNDLNSELKNLKPNLIFMDINLPGDKTGIELTKEIKTYYPATKVLILSIHNESTIVRKALENGASAYITKNSSIEEVQLAVKKVLSGEKYLCKEVENYV